MNLEAEVEKLKLANTQLLAAIQGQQAMLQDTRKCMEKLAKISKLEWSQDIKDWVSISKLAELKKNPRENKLDK